MHTRVLSSFFLFFSLSFCSLFPLLFRDRRPLPPSQALSPFFFLSLSLILFCVTHATSTLERARALHPLHRDVLSKIQPFFSPADQWALPLPLYPPVPTSPFSLFVIRFKISFPFTCPLANNLFGPLPVHSRRCSPERENRLSASLGFLAAALLLSSSSSSHNIPADITALFQFRPNLPECCQFSSAVVVHNIAFAVLKGSRYS